MIPLQSPAPFLKWPGGKRRLLPELRASLPSKYGTYFEPFVGAGALLFDLQPARFVISDLNEDLMVCYQALQQDVGGLIARLQGFENTKEEYLQIRALDRHLDYKRMPVLDRAARFIYLNRTCFNGLHRVNSQGFFNVAFGGYKNPRICDDWGLVAVHTYLRAQAKGKRILCGDYRAALKTARAGDFVYLDPPYDGTWNEYQAGGFTAADQKDLTQKVNDLTRTGVLVMLSNSNTERIRDLYSRYHVQVVKAVRSISCDGNRDKAEEVIVTNYVPGQCQVIELKRGVIWV
jgi:DNA adenine methylase